MVSEHLDELRRIPPDRSTVGFVTLLLGALRAFLSRFFAGKNPVGFDQEFGSWQFPDIILSTESSRPPPRPLIFRDCRRTVLVYCFVAIPTARCTLPGQLAALGQAAGMVFQYLRDEFRCENPDCPEENGEPVWVGLKCSAGPSDGAAILVRFSCLPKV